MDNIKRYQDDLKRLINVGERLLAVIIYEYDLKQTKEQTEDMLREQLGDRAMEILKDCPSFPKTYQSWYSEAKVVISQLLPDRLNDFVEYYEKPKSRKYLTYESYRIADCLLGLETDYVGPRAGIPLFEQQLAIVKAVQGRFESSLYDIRQMLQSDLFDSELEAAEELAKCGFLRAGGALAGVVMERHLGQVCKNHAVKLRKKKPTIADYNDALKEADVIDVPRWRLNQHLGDLRNLCDHSKDAEPTREQVTDLLSGVMKLTKTLS